MSRVHTPPFILIKLADVPFAADFQKGHPLTEAELDALQEHRLAKIRLGNADTNAIPAYCLAEVMDAEDNAGIALILCTGDSFSELTIWVHDIFETKASVLAYLRENGWTT